MKVECYRHSYCQRAIKSTSLTATRQLHLLFFAESRVTILPAILRHLQYHIKNRDDLLDKTLDVLGSILTNLHDQEQVGMIIIILYM